MTNPQNSVLSFQTVSTKVPAPQDSEADTALALALTLAQAADDRKGANIRVLKVAEVSYLADYFVIVTGFSPTQVRAIARSLKDSAEEKLHRQPVRSEGEGDCSWILQDYGDVIVHVFLPDEREFYGLEAFWGHAEEIPLETYE